MPADQFVVVAQPTAQGLELAFGDGLSGGGQGWDAVVGKHADIMAQPPGGPAAAPPAGAAEN